MSLPIGVLVLLARLSAAHALDEIYSAMRVIVMSVFIDDFERVDLLGEGPVGVDDHNDMGWKR